MSLEPPYDPELVKTAFALDKQRLDSAEDRAAVDVRRFALSEAIELLRGTNTQVRDADAVLLCAAKFHRWLKDGELPDLGESVKHLSDYSWGLVRGLYPEADIQRAMQGGEQ